MTTVRKGQSRALRSACLLAGSLALCSCPAPPSSPLDNKRLTLDSVWTACDTDAKCSAVELDCCDYCNGGTAVAVRRDAIGELRDRFMRLPCNEVECTDLSCAPLHARCAEGTCRLVDPGWIRPPDSLPRGE